MSTPIVAPEPLIDFIRRYDGFVMLGHLEPDGDCVGSELALSSALRRMGKTVQVLNPGPFDRQEIAGFESHFDIAYDADALPDNHAVIVVDCSSEDRIERFATHIRHLEMAVIDHHRAGEPFGDVRFVRPDIPATTIIITYLIEQLGLRLTADEATWLFLGLVTDTGFFRFLDTDQAVAFEAASRLTRAGASPRTIDRIINGGRSYESRLLISRVLDRMERLGDGSIILTHQTRRDEMELGTRRDSDALYRLLLAIEGVRVIAVAKEKENGCTVSFRSADDTDVSGLAAQIGGGGHQRASGAFTSLPLAQFLPSLRKQLLTL